MKITVTENKTYEQVAALPQRSSTDAPIEQTENAILLENYRLQKKIEALSDEINRLKALTYSAPEEK